MLYRKSKEKENSTFESPEPLYDNEHNPFLTEPEPPIPVKPKSSSVTPSAVLGPKIRFKGELHGEEDLLIQGLVDGVIDLKGHKLIVGEEGAVKANIFAKSIVVQGKVKGDLFASERITIAKTSNVQGNVKGARVVLEDGAKFRGSIDMDTKTNQASKTGKSAMPQVAASQATTPTASSQPTSSDEDKTTDES